MNHRARMLLFHKTGFLPQSLSPLGGSRDANMRHWYGRYRPLRLHFFPQCFLLCILQIKSCTKLKAPSSAVSVLSPSLPSVLLSFVIVVYSALESSYSFYDSIKNSWLPVVSGLLASSQAQFRQLVQMSLEVPTSVSPGG